MTIPPRGGSTLLLVGACVHTPETPPPTGPAALHDSPCSADSRAYADINQAYAELLRRADAAKAGERIVICLEGGVHRLSRPMVFEPGRFGPGGPSVVIAAMPGERPVISGAREVGGWSLHDRDLNIYRTHVGDLQSRQLFVNGQRAQRARTEPVDGNYPAGFKPSPTLPSDPMISPYVIDGSIEYRPTDENPANWKDPARWGNPWDIEAVIRFQWKMMSVPLLEVRPDKDGGTGHIIPQQPAWSNANMFFQSTPRACEEQNRCVKSAFGAPINACDEATAPGMWSLWQVSYFENAYEFLDRPGEWYLNRASGELFYMPRFGEDMRTARVEMPVLESLVEAIGTPERPVTDIRFEGITFAHATWMAPSGALPDGPTPGRSQGYVADQSGFHLVGDRHRPNTTGHAEQVARTPGALRFAYAQGIEFIDNAFEQMGAVALDFASGSQGNLIAGNRFSDISSAAIQLGGVGPEDHHPTHAASLTRDNTIRDNLISQVGREFVDAAGIFVGFSRNTLISHNTIREVPWSGIAMGWGWGLLDPGMFPGLATACSGMWGNYDTPTPNSGNRIVNNLIERFLEVSWDGGAVYTTGQQGQSADAPLLIEGNVAHHRNPKRGGNTFYNDGGSRYVLLRGNVSYDNPLGPMDMGPAPQLAKPTYNGALSLVNGIPYGGDYGGCRTYGDIRYEGNYWMEGLIPLEELVLGKISQALTKAFQRKPYSVYSREGFFDICPYTENGVQYPTRLVYRDNHWILGEFEVPRAIIEAAGVHE